MCNLTLTKCYLSPLPVFLQNFQFSIKLSRNQNRNCILVFRNCGINLVGNRSQHRYLKPFKYHVMLKPFGLVFFKKSGLSHDMMFDNNGQLLSKCASQWQISLMSSVVLVNRNSLNMKHGCCLSPVF